MKTTYHNSQIKVVKIQVMNNPREHIFMQPIIDDISNYIYLAVELKERVDPENTEYSLCINYKILNDVNNVFNSGWSWGISWGVTIKNNIVSNHNKGMDLDLFGLEGNNIGSYLLTEMLSIIQAKYPNAILPSFTLTHQSDLRSISLFKKFGITFDKVNNSYMSVETKLKDITHNHIGAYPNITTFSIDEYLYLIYQQEQDIITEYHDHKNQYERNKEKLLTYLNDSFSLMGSWFFINNSKEVYLYKSKIKPISIPRDGIESHFKINHFLSDKLVLDDVRNLRILTQNIIIRNQAMNNKTKEMYLNLNQVVEKINKMQKHPFFYAFLKLISIKSVYVQSA